jgi:hypothetical protein
MQVEYDKLVPALKRLLPAQRLEVLGLNCRFIRRLRAVTASTFVWAVVLSRFGQGVPGFDQARQWFAQLRGIHIWPRPFQMRFKNRAAVRLFEEAFDAAVKPWRAVTRHLHHPLARYFSDIVIWDSTLVELAGVLRQYLKGNRSAASLKVVLGISLWGLLPLAARVVAGCRNDNKLGPPLELLRKGALLLFDKGFVAYDRLQEIDEKGQFYLCPMRLNGTAELVKARQAPARVRRTLKRRARLAEASEVQPPKLMLRSVLPTEKRIRTAWDLDVLLRGPHKRPLPARLVILPGPDGKQRPYLTNLSPTPWHPDALRELYRLRWQVELVFKELKQHLNLRTMPSKDPYAVQAFAWASLIALAVSRAVADWLVPLRDYAGLSFTLRPAVLTRALRAHVRLLGHALMLPPHRAALLLEVLALQLLDEARQTTPARSDSFKRLENLLEAA